MYWPEDLQPIARTPCLGEALEDIAVFGLIVDEERRSGEELLVPDVGLSRRTWQSNNLRIFTCAIRRVPRIILVKPSQLVPLDGAIGFGGTGQTQSGIRGQL
jgi:hypothetical protein